MITRRIAALQCTKLFGSLLPEELSDIARRANDLHLQRGEMLFLSGEPTKGLFVVVGGEIRVFRQNEDGREQVMHIDRAGAVLGLSLIHISEPTRQAEISYAVFC